MKPETLARSGLGLLLVTAAPGAAVEKGPYVAFELGVGVGGSMVLHGTDDDVATTCDGWIVPLDGTNAGCNPPPSAWTADINDTGSGFAGSIALGYRLFSFRGELELVHSTFSYDEVSDVLATDDVSVAKREQEIEAAETRVETVQHEAIFANVYWDVPPTVLIWPYVGIGIGVADVSVDYFNRWKRNSDPGAIVTFEGHPDAAELRRILAGTTTVASAKLKDTATAIQILAGVDFRVAETVVLGFKARLVQYEDFETDRLLWDQLRSHHSSRSPGGEEVSYVVSTDDLSLWALSFGLKYRF
ncbi:MAG: outer membrane beta-barrel protein [Chloroflexi bacterium]|nr:outer membrane beta-barrel protein [Chloroflexota bacterium]